MPMRRNNECWSVPGWPGFAAVLVCAVGISAGTVESAATGGDPIGEVIGKPMQMPKGAKFSLNPPQVARATYESAMRLQKEDGLKRVLGDKKSMSPPARIKWTEEGQ